METLPIPDFFFMVKKWEIRHYKEKSEIWCTSALGKVFIIKNGTHDITHIPYYVLTKIAKHGLLERWREYQIEESLKRLRHTITIFRKFKEKRQPIPV